MTHDPYGFSALVSQTPFGGETGGSVAKRRLFSGTLRKKFPWQKYNPRDDVMNCPFINVPDSMDYRFLLVTTSPQESAVLVVITLTRPVSYLGKFFHRLHILPCRYRCTIHEYWSSWHWCHIQEKKHRIRQCLEQQTYWLMEKFLKGINSGPHMWRKEYPFFRGISHFFS